MKLNRGSPIQILLSQPRYYTRYPSLGLLKLSSFHKMRGDGIEFHDSLRPADVAPEQIYVTSLFTYSWKPVHDTVEYYRKRYPKAKITLGGIYATLMPEHARLSGANKVHTGLLEHIDGLLPDYDLVPDWESSIMFGTRGCIRKCAFCAVPKLEGKTWGPATGVKDLIHPDHKKVILWDNNILGVDNWREVVSDLKERNVIVDFNQGLDARLINEEVAKVLGGLRIRPIRMAYDIPSERRALERAIPALESAGFNRRQMHVYTLYNFMDTPDEFLSRVVDLLNWGVVSYPMRYEPLNSLVKNKYISPHWTPAQLEMVAKARRVLGFGGAFPPYQGLVDKLTKAKTFEEAFSLRPNPKGTDRAPKAIAGTIEAHTPKLSGERVTFRELLNDPATLQSPVPCMNCEDSLAEGERAFAVQDYGGKYVGYICHACHPNRKWINGLWRTVLGSSFSINGQIPIDIEMLTRTVH